MFSEINRIIKYDQLRFDVFMSEKVRDTDNV